jgi:hypothetical protein
MVDAAYGQEVLLMLVVSFCSLLKVTGVFSKGPYVIFSSRSLSEYEVLQALKIQRRWNAIRCFDHLNSKAASVLSCRG